MKHIIKLLILTTILTGCLVSSAMANVLNDVPKTHWAYGPISFMVSSDMMKTDQNGNFNPNAYIDKFDTSKILARMLGFDPNSKQNHASYEKYKNIINPYSVKYKKWNNSANEAIAFLLEKKIYKPEDLDLFIIMTAEGEEKLRALSLEELSIYLVRRLGRTVEAERGDYKIVFSDDAVMNPSSKPYLYYLHQKNFIKTDSQGNILPRSAVTKSLMAVLVYEALDNSVYEYSVSDILQDGKNGKTGEYVYAEPTEKSLPDSAYEMLKMVNDEITALQAIKVVASSLTEEQKKDVEFVDLITRFAEEAVSRAYIITEGTGTISVNQQTLDYSQAKAIKLAREADEVLIQSGVQQNWHIRSIVKIKAVTNEEMNISFEKVNMEADILKIENRDMGFYLKKDYVNQIQIPSGIKLANEGDNGYLVDMLGEEISDVITLALPPVSGEKKYQSAFDSKGNATGGKYNPVIDKLEVKIRDSGHYQINSKQKTFVDIQDKSDEMQNAILVLTAKGILSGTSATEFSPDSPVTRADFAIMILKAISKYEKGLNGNFKDVTDHHYFYEAAGSARKYGIISGFEDNTFRGKQTIPKEQLVAIVARTLKAEMPYVKEDTSRYLDDYEDATHISEWAKDFIGFGSRTGLVIDRTDNYFVPEENMTRGDAAVMIKRLVDKIW